MVTGMLQGWMGEPPPLTSSSAVIKCNLEQTAAFISAGRGQAQVVDTVGDVSQPSGHVYFLNTDSERNLEPSAGVNKSSSWLHQRRCVTAVVQLLLRCMKHHRFTPPLPHPPVIHVYETQLVT